MDYSDLAQQLNDRLQKLFRCKKPKQLTESMQGEAFILQYLFMRNEVVLPGEIGNTMHISSARIAAALGSLENKGLVTREINKDDRRQILVLLTDEGKKLAAENARQRIEHIAAMLESIGEQDAKALIRIIDKVAETSSKQI